MPSLNGSRMQLDVLVVGGGIAGLACAHALCRAGHHVTVLEEDTETSRISGGVRIPPNLYKILMEWGLEEELKKIPSCTKTNFFSMDTGDLLGYFPMHEEVLAEMGGGFVPMDHHSLKTLLLKLATSSGATIRYNTSVKAVSATSSGASIQLEDGQTLDGDMVIGADGAASCVRLAISDGAPEDEVTIPSGWSMYSMSVPSEKLRNDPYWADWVDEQEWGFWMTEKRMFLGFPVKDFSEYAIVMKWPDEALPEHLVECQDKWGATIPTSSLNTAPYAPSVKRLLAMSPTISRLRYYERPHVMVDDDWMDETGRILLIGDAAHPFLPCAIQGPAMAIEDAALLAGLFDTSRRPLLLDSQTSLAAHSAKWIPILTSAFQDLRQDRCIMVHHNELSNMEFLGMPPGSDRDERDRGIAMSLQMEGKVLGDEEKEGMMRAQSDEIFALFAYSATDSAEEWWRTWGNLHQVQESPPPAPISLPRSNGINGHGNGPHERQISSPAASTVFPSPSLVFWDMPSISSSICTTSTVRVDWEH